MRNEDERVPATGKAEVEALHGEWCAGGQIAGHYSWKTECGFCGEQEGWRPWTVSDPEGCGEEMLAYPVGSMETSKGFKPESDVV